jgi:benzodiazapine receptor
MLCLSLGMLSGYGANSGDSIWYASLNKPSFNPPSWLFGPAWTILYLMMGTALGKIWNNKAHNKLLLIIFSIQFILNMLWSPLFFYFHRVDVALYDLSLLWISLLTFMVLAWKQRSIFLLCLPYIIWTCFALLLNYTIYTLN